jgi:hypothetical protein
LLVRNGEVSDNVVQLGGIIASSLRTELNGRLTEVLYVWRICEPPYLRISEVVGHLGFDGCFSPETVGNPITPRGTSASVLTEVDDYGSRSGDSSDILINIMKEPVKADAIFSLGRESGQGNEIDAGPWLS